MHTDRDDTVRDAMRNVAEWIAATDEDEERAHVIGELRHALQMKDRFLTIAAHEMRNPLAPIRYALDLLTRGADDEMVVNHARALISRQVTQLSRFVDDLLDLSRCTHGQLDLHIEKVDLPTVADAAVETAYPLISAREHTLIQSMPPHRVTINADAGRLTQVLTNLLINAAKFTKQRGTIWLTVSMEPDWALVSVRDTGVGIAPDMLRNIFDVYVQAEQNADTVKGGTGLGLTLARHLVELHGGTLRCQSEGLGKGSTFTVRLPAASESVRARCA